MPTATSSSIADDFDSDSDSPQRRTAVVAEGDAVGIDSKSAQMTTTPVPATTGDAGDLPSATTAMDVDFDSDLSPAQSTAVAESDIAAANTNFYPDTFPLQTAGVTPTGTAADIDFDSDSSPAKPPVVVAMGTAADVDFDSDSSAAATPVPAEVADAMGVNFDSNSQPPAEANGATGNGGVEELLRLASEVEEEEVRNVSSITSRPANRSSADDPCPKPLQQGGQAEPNGAGAVAASAHKRRRCGIVYLGGETSDWGFCASSLSQRSCNRLRCTHCNFEVLRFDAKAWDESAIDYMFLRNNSPDPVKLSVRLLDCPGACAYACQCSWKTVKDLRVLLPTERPRWACGGHD